MDNSGRGNIKERLQSKIGSGKSLPAGKFSFLIILLLALITALYYLGSLTQKKDGQARPQNNKIKVKLPGIENESVVFGQYIKYFQEKEVKLSDGSFDRRFITLLSKLDSIYSDEKLVKELAVKSLNELIARYTDYYGIPPADIEDFSRRIVFDTPEVSLGKFFTLKGKLLQIYPEAVNIGDGSKYEFYDKEYVYLVVINPGGMNNPYWVYLTEKPEGHFKTKKTESGDEYIEGVTCEVTGLFIRLQEFETQDKKVQTNTAAIFIANNFKATLMAEGGSSITGQWIYLLIGGCLLIAALLVVMSYMSSKYESVPLKSKIRRLKQLKSGG